MTDRYTVLFSSKFYSLSKIQIVGLMILYGDIHVILN